MKVIDLLNKIANGEEVPKKIQVYSDIFVFDDSNGVYEHEETRTNLLSIYNGNILNYEVRIKAEDKKIEKVDLLNYFEIIPDGHFNTEHIYNQCVKIHDNTILLQNKINEIIDYLEENKNEN